jgi:GNAT superfamily N-acetyltransferase
MLRVVTDPTQIDLRLAHRWIASSYWSTNIPWERFERACAKSLVYAAFDGDEQVGFSRVVTDCVTFAWLCDVFVAEHARRRGVGQQLMQAITADRRLEGLRQFMLSTRDAHGLYARFGFEPVGEPHGRYMRIVRSPAEVYGS